MSFFDSHCHLKSFWEKGELSQVISRAKKAEVNKMVTVGTSSEDWQIYHRLAVRFAGTIYYSIGLHPSYVDDSWREHVSALRSFWEMEKKPVALGEIGLDYFRLPKDWEQKKLAIGLQKDAFKKQLAWARELEVPVIIHSRNAFEDCVDMIDSSGLNWNNVVFHCFSEGIEQAKILSDRGGRASYTGIMTHKKNSFLLESLKVQKLENLMIETDSPYLSPVPCRGKTNEPANLCLLGNFLAKELKVSLEELAGSTKASTEAFYRI